MPDAIGRNLMKKFFILIALSVLLTACHIPRPILIPTETQEMSESEESAQPDIQLTFTLPPPVFATPSPTSSTTDTPEPGYGSIAGNIYNYPYGAIPQLSIVAHEQKPPYHYWYLITGAGNTYYSMDGYISTGEYQVVAYDPSGHAGGCLTQVQVKNNELVLCDITDWSGSYPAKPAGVP